MYIQKTKEIKMKSKKNQYPQKKQPKIEKNKLFPPYNSLPNNLNPLLTPPTLLIPIPSPRLTNRWLRRQNRLLIMILRIRQRQRMLELPFPIAAMHGTLGVQSAAIRQRIAVCADAFRADVPACSAGDAAT